ncbi:polyphosphate:AMP phosphotransferase [Jingyaoa shaoxingensis]|uniref:Polyphosphate:AMP phosphotransferase n=1 Tax=Jingyaoa shaoxingensis TaxID=2763671 RepID=A0ABR7N9E2_9FIRM|nr:polyphosphate:AMP phosphotransferase [Jingyaoa shaoxingensis]MBC8573017.1 polyphosphate:AMP phosphotransferase [Jingyaoa shaoxingensis]
MLTNWNPAHMPEKEELKTRLSDARNQLYDLQMKIKEHKVPVLALFEGWGTAGKGSTIGKVIRNIDPRFFKVVTMSEPTAEEQRYPFLYRYFKHIPEQGKFTFLDSGWMEQICRERLEEKNDEKEYGSRIESIRRFERQLTDNGYLVLKFFMHIDQEEQKKREERLLEHKDTRWRVSEFDRWENAHYKKCVKVFSQYMSDTNASTSPWYIIDASERKWAELQVLETMISNIQVALQNQAHSVPILQNVFPLEQIPRLSEIELKDKELEEAEYKTELKKLQSELGELHNRLYRKRIPVIITYEGWDAAGKGGNIKRITEALDPRGYEVHPIASPEPHEKARHYLWRFWTRLPKNGHIAIFDRTWYGRVMVERLEGFCSENDWRRAYNEINEFEKELKEWGAVIIKFWVQIDKDTQLERFEERQNTPEKQWKITEEDWRNREKWDDYEVAVDEMLQKTNTSFAPWHVLESVDKKYARIKALKIVIEEIQKALGE